VAPRLAYRLIRLGATPAVSTTAVSLDFPWQR